MTGVVANFNLERLCGERNQALCSRTRQGSPRAIHEGVGDVHSFLLFPEATAVGEYFLNDPEGFDHCRGVPRDMAVAKERGTTAQQFYEACRASGTQGEIHAMGSAYSTIWYGILKRAEARGAKPYLDAKNLFYEHLKAVTSDDDFISAKAMIKSIDSNIFGGQFSADIDAEYAAMGY